MNKKGDESMKGEAYYSVRMRASENGPHEEGENTYPEESGLCLSSV